MVPGAWPGRTRFGKRNLSSGFVTVYRVSFETSFDSKQPKLEPKPVSALSETKRLFQLFRFYIETESFDVLIEPKPTEDQPKQFDIGSIFFAQICEVTTREKVPCHAYVIILL